MTELSETTFPIVTSEYPQQTTSADTEVSTVIQPNTSTPDTITVPKTEENPVPVSDPLQTILIPTVDTPQIPTTDIPPIEVSQSTETPSSRQTETVETSAPEVTDPVIVVGKIEATPGIDDVVLPIVLKNNPGIASVALKVEFDERLKLKEVVFNSNLPGESLQPQSYLSPVKLVWISPFQNATGDFLLAELHFSIPSGLAPGKYVVTLSYDPDDLYDMNETNIAFFVSGGYVDIK